MMSKRFFIISLMVIGLLINGFNLTIRSEPSAGIFLINEPNDWDVAGFDNTGRPIYNSEGLTEFFMPVALNKSVPKFKDIKESQLKHTIKHADEYFNGRLRNIDFTLLESDTHYVVLYHMLVFASNQSFSIDFVPKIKGEEYTQFAWWNSSYSFFRTITIDSSKIDNPLVGFPILVAIPDATADKCDNGDSIRFLLPDNVTELPYEIEDWTDGNDRIVWVNVSRIDSAVDTVFLMYYNNSGASDNQDAVNVWDSNYKVVYHMQDKTTSTVADITTNSNDGTKTSANNPAVTISGKIGKGQDFDGSDRITVDANPGITNQITLEAWVKVDSISGGKQHIFNKWSSGDLCYFFRVNDDDLNFFIGDGGTGQDSTTVLACMTTSWMHLVVVHDAGTNKLNIYVDSVEHADTTTVNLGNDSTPVSIGVYDPTPGYYLSGLLDEIRFSNVDRNASWIKASFHSQNQTTDFLIWGDEVSAPTINITNYPPVLSNFYPSNRSNFTCPCCVVFGVTVSDNDSAVMNITLFSNGTANIWNDYFGIENVRNGTYYFTVEESFCLFNYTYYWNVSVNDGNTTIWSDTYYFTTGTFDECNASGLTELQADELFLSSAFELTTDSLILLIWMFFIVLGEWKIDWVYKILQLPIGLTYGVTLLGANTFLGIGVIFGSIYILAIAYWQGRKPEGET